MTLTRDNRRTRLKTCPDATLSTKNPTLDVTGLKQGRRVETSAANRLSGGRKRLKRDGTR
jgi:hypothetical protein